MRRTSETENRSSCRGISLTTGGWVVLVLFCFLPGASFARQTVNSADTSQGPRFKAQGQLVFVKQGTGAQITMITIQIADNEQERAQGLMWRSYMPDNEGMLFIFDDQEDLTFWMKNTYIPLDMVFADKTGKIVHIYRDATPLSEASIPSGSPAQYVVEVNAGFCSRYDIKAGDRIIFER